MFKKGITAYTCVILAVLAGLYIQNNNILSAYPRNRLAIVGRPYQSVCPANFLIPLKGLVYKLINVSEHIDNMSY